MHNFFISPRRLKRARLGNGGEKVISSSKAERNESVHFHSDLNYLNSLFDLVLYLFLCFLFFVVFTKCRHKLNENSFFSYLKSLPRQQRDCSTSVGCTKESPLPCCCLGRKSWVTSCSEPSESHETFTRKKLKTDLSCW